MHALAAQFLKEGKGFGARYWVESVQRFIEHEDLGVMSNGLCKANFLTHAFAVTRNLPSGRITELIRTLPKPLRVNFVPAPDVAREALAGIGPDRTRIEIWADPTITRNIHRIEVEAAAARLSMQVENVPSDDNPRTGRLTALSAIAALKKLVSPLAIGT